LNPYTHNTYPNNFVSKKSKILGNCTNDIVVYHFVMILSQLLALALTNPATKPIDKTEYILVDKPGYSFEVPKGWKIGEETPWGARDMSPKEGNGKLGAMTTNASGSTWDNLYRTSLYFIKREDSKAKETEYRLGKTKQGYESMSFEMVMPDGFKNRRYVIFQNAKGSALALSVKIPSKKEEAAYILYFQRMVDTAKIK